ncbi:hypothetical protein FB451DRAFT_1380065 [Mycena latifolia]|nr:hypothetical protein FB451DRAFT_1380065 [Mycena latifolia]
MFFLLWSLAALCLSPPPARGLALDTEKGLHLAALFITCTITPPLAHPVAPCFSAASLLSPSSPGTIKDAEQDRNLQMVIWVSLTPSMTLQIFPKRVLLQGVGVSPATMLQITMAHAMQHLSRKCVGEPTLQIYLLFMFAFIAHRKANMDPIVQMVEPTPDCGRVMLSTGSIIIDLSDEDAVPTALPMQLSSPLVVAMILPLKEAKGIAAFSKSVCCKCNQNNCATMLQYDTVQHEDLADNLYWCNPDALCWQTFWAPLKKQLEKEGKTDAQVELAEQEKWVKSPPPKTVPLCFGMILLLVQSGCNTLWAWAKEQLGKEVDAQVELVGQAKWVQNPPPKKATEVSIAKGVASAKLTHAAVVKAGPWQLCHSCNELIEGERFGVDCCTVGDSQKHQLKLTFFKNSETLAMDRSH